MRFKDDAGDLPFFIQSSLSEDLETKVPWTTSSAAHAATKKMKEAGLNDTNRLVETGEAVEVTPINPLLAPNLYRIKDIKLYDLTNEEIDEGVNKNPVIIEMKKIRTDLFASLNKKYGNRKNWPEEDRKEFR
ncbi:hypothetical protein BD770DRAFT_428174 [Pilaira anomala]|nr:hypothetical protein BD770DRAFT_428174 [Pilaira anomala]